MAIDMMMMMSSFSLGLQFCSSVGAIVSRYFYVKREEGLAVDSGVLVHTPGSQLLSHRSPGPQLHHL